VGEYYADRYRLGVAILGDPGQAEEATGRTLALASLDASWPTGDLESQTWLYRLAVRQLEPD
jgi:hypothetical protein